MRYILFLLAALTAYQLHATDLKESMISLSLGSQRVTYDNRVDVDFDANENPVMIYSFEKDGSYLQALNKYWVPTANPIALKGLYFLDFLVVENNYYVLAVEHAGYKGDGSLDYEEEGNILVFLKIKPDGTTVYKKNLFGHNGTTGGNYFLCTMSGNGELAFDGTYFHAFAETCGNFSSPGSSSFDIHEGDYYLTFTKEGVIREGGESPWNHSHSGLLQLVTDGVGEAYTLEVSDGGPWGINFDHFSNGKRVTSQTLFPDASTLPYADMYAAATSSTDAGDIGGMVQLGEYFYTVIATVPGKNHPISKQHKDLLLVKFNKAGESISQTWIKQTPDLDESVPFIQRYGDAIFMVYMKRAGEFNYDYKATFALLNPDGTYIIEPTATEYVFNYQSRFIRFPNGDVGLISVQPYAEKVDIIRFGTGTLPNFSNAGDAANMKPSDQFKTATVQHLMPAVTAQPARDNDKTNRFNEQMQFNGFYTAVNPVDPDKGVYVEGVYKPDAPGLKIELDEIDLENFVIEVEFKVDALRNAPVFSISRSYRVIEYFMNDDGYLYLSLNNGDIIVDSGIAYKTNTWYTAKVEVNGETISMYLDGVLIAQTKATLNTANTRVNDISTTNYSRGWAFEGYIRSVKAGKAY